MKTYEMNYLFVLAFASLLFLTRVIVRLQKENMRMKAELQREKEEIQSLQRSAFAQQKLLSLISHHIRGPFQFVLRMLDLLSNKWKDIQEKERNESVHMIRNSLDEMDRTLRDVIDWARRKQEGEENSSSVMQSGDIVAEEATFLASAARWKEIQIMERVDIDAPVTVDKGALHLVMQNLISNALKYSQKGQIIEVFSEPYGLGLLSIGVADEAGGLPEDAANRIFSPAGHESSSGTLEEQGTGVGLLLAQDLAEQMGTEIQLISDEKGSRFFLVFPTSTSQG